jgi:hypothetical protein
MLAMLILRILYSIVRLSIIDTIQVNEAYEPYLGKVKHFSQ